MIYIPRKVATGMVDISGRIYQELRLISDYSMHDIDAVVCFVRDPSI
jgi:hypothetical protein